MKQFIQRIFRQTNTTPAAQSDWNETHEQDLANFAAQLKAQKAENAGRKPAAVHRRVA